MIFLYKILFHCLSKINFSASNSNFVCANPLVREDYGKVAIQRGPIIYCAEGVDNGDNLHLITIDTNKKINIYLPN